MNHFSEMTDNAAAIAVVKCTSSNGRRYPVFCIMERWLTVYCTCWKHPFCTVQGETKD